MLANGAPVKIVSDILGHSSIAITGDIYGHTTTEDARSGVGGQSISRPSWVS